MSTFIRESGKYKPYELQHRFRKKLFSLGKIIILICILYLFVAWLFCFTVSVGSEAMEPTFGSGNRLLATPLLYGPALPFTADRRIFTIRPPSRGDVVVYVPQHLRTKEVIYRIADPIVNFFTLQQVRSVSKITREQYPRHLVRRVAGIPGDTIELRGKKIFIRTSGKEQIIKDFHPTETARPVHGRTTFPLGENEYFLLSDNRNRGLDSRHFGPVDGSGIAGKVFFIYYPLKEFGTP
jgi:signal peptidase I